MQTTTTNDIESLNNNSTMNIDPFSPLKQQNTTITKTPKKQSNIENGLSDSQFMDVDEDDYNNILNNFDENQDFKKFNSIFSNETDFQAFLDILEKKETDAASKKSPKFYEFARNSLYLQFDPIVQKLSSTLSPDKIKRISLIRDKTEVIKNFLSEIQEEEGSFSHNNSINNGNNNTNSSNEDLAQTQPITIPTTTKVTTPKTLPSSAQVQQTISLTSPSIKTPTEEALAFLEKAKIQIKKQNSINENGFDTPITAANTSTSSISQQPFQLKQQERRFRNDKIQNLLSELSLDEQNEGGNEKASINIINTTTSNNNDNEHENDKSQNQQHNVNESDNSAQIIDIDRYRIDFTTSNDEDFDFLNDNSTIKTNRASNASVTSNNQTTPIKVPKHNRSKPPSIDNDQQQKALDASTNGDGAHHVNDYIEQIFILKENEKLHLETIKFLQDENSKFKTIAVEFERIFQNLIKDKEESEIKLKHEILELTKERDHLQEDVIGVEKAFDDLHRRFEKLKTKVEEFKKNEEQLTKANEILKQQIEKEKQKYATLKKHAEEKLELANVEIDKLRKSSAAELQALRAEIRKSEIKISSLELTVQQKDQENTQLTNLLEELLSKVKPN